MAPPVSPVASIRRRLLLLLMRAFGAIVLLTVLLLLAVFAVFTRTETWRPGVNLIVGAPLEAYYQGHGSWEGVETVRARTVQSSIPADFGREWNAVILLDAQGRVVLDNLPAGQARTGQHYLPQPGDVLSPLTANGQTIGNLVITNGGGWESLRFLAQLLFPLAIISLFTGALTLLIALLLMRRVATPLADVIGAAQTVAAGDLTTRVQVRGPGDLRGLSESFNHMADALERSDHARRALLADVAHELRTPLTVMRGRLEGIVDGIYAADEDHVAPVLEETYVLERLVEDLHQLTLAEARQLPLDRGPVNLGDVVARAVDLFCAEAAEAGQTLTLEAAPGLPNVMADPQRVAQVIGNLLSNALRYTGPGGQVTVRVEAPGRGVRVVVSDTGAGIAAADLPHVFDRFYRGEKSRARGSGGAGLGLAIARAWIQAMDGEIGAESTPGRGSSFWFVLPGLA
jgi:signal transduction histidine kinase